MEYRSVSIVKRKVREKEREKEVGKRKKEFNVASVL